MIAGTVVMEDVTIHFVVDGDDMVQVTVGQTNMHGDVVTDAYSTPMAGFMKALAIAVHPDGTPDFRADYAAAEEAQGPSIRWIP